MFDEAMDSDSQRLVWGLFQRGVVAVAMLFFGGLLGQIVPWAGPRGVHPAVELCTLRRQHFKLWRQLLQSPMQVAFSIFPPTDRVLLGFTWLGVLNCVLFIALGWWPAFVGVLVCYVSLVEAAYAFWPWHCLLGEVMWILLLSGSPFHMAAFPSLSASTLPSPHVLFAWTWLTFRVLFGFGKMKFTGSRWADRMYLRAFMVNIPLPTPIGVWCHFHLPRWTFAAGYIVYFASEIIAPFLFFFPMPWRGLSALSLVGLMIGIQLTGNFGFFNILTALLALPLFLPSTQSWWSLPSTWCDILVLTHALLAAPLLAFNSWIASSWFNWPYIRRFSPFVSNLYGTLSAWRIMVPYGVFPPRTFPASRRLPYFEVSDDGHAWRRMQYKYQPYAFSWGVHPIVDIWAHYMIGMGGLTGSLLNGLSPFLTASHVYTSIVRNLLQHGTARALFRDEDLNAPLPRYVRMVRVVIIPDERTVTLRELLDVTVEVPPVCLSDLTERPDLLPEAFAPTLDDCDPSFNVFRRESELYQKQLAEERSNYFRGDVVLPIDTAVELCAASSVEDAAAVFDRKTASLGAIQVKRLQRALSRRAFALLDVVEKPLYFSKPIFDKGPTHALLHVACLVHAAGVISYLKDSAALIRSVEETVANGMDSNTMRIGLRLFVFANAMLLRRESLHARHCAFYGGYQHIIPSAVSILDAVTYELPWIDDEVEIDEKWIAAANEWSFLGHRVLRKRIEVVD